MERQREKRDICPCGCGQPIDEAWTPVSEGGPVYEAIDYECRAGNALRGHQKRMQEDAEQMPALRLKARVPVVLPKRSAPVVDPAEQAGEDGKGAEGE